MKKLASLLINIILLLVFTNTLAFSAVTIVSGTNTKTYSFKDETITTSSYLELTLSRIGGASSWGVTDYSQSTQNIDSIVIDFIDAFGTTISTKSIAVGTYYDVKDIPGSSAKIRFYSGVASPVTATGVIKFNFGSSGESSSYDSTTGTTQVTESSPWGLQRIVPQETVLSSTTNTTAIDASLYNKVKITVEKSGTAVVDIQESYDNVTWINALTDQDGVVSIGEETFKYVRANVSSYTSGTITINIMAGN